MLQIRPKVRGNPKDKFREKSIKIAEYQLKILSEKYGFEFQEIEVLWPNGFRDRGYRLSLPIKKESELIECYPCLKNLRGCVDVYYRGKGEFTFQNSGLHSPDKFRDLSALLDFVGNFLTSSLMIAYAKLIRTKDYAKTFKKLEERMETILKEKLNRLKSTVEEEERVKAEAKEEIPLIEEKEVKEAQEEIKQYQPQNQVPIVPLSTLYYLEFSESIKEEVDSYKERGTWDEKYIDMRFKLIVEKILQNLKSKKSLYEKAYLTRARYENNIISKEEYFKELAKIENELPTY